MSFFVWKTQKHRAVKSPDCASATSCAPRRGSMRRPPSCSPQTSTAAFSKSPDVFMKAITIMEKTIDPSAHACNAVIQFEEGLIGFSDCKSFVLVESEDLAPFRRLQSTE